MIHYRKTFSDVANQAKNGRVFFNLSVSVARLVTDVVQMFIMFLFYI